MTAAQTVRYGSASLADLLPSALAALGAPDHPNPLEIPPTRSVVVLLVDGLGWNLLRAHPRHAPFLSTLAARPLTAGFPTTTVASIASLGTGLPPGQHGLTGYTSRLDGLDDPINWLAWKTAHGQRDLLADRPPESVQPGPTMFQRAEQAGITVSVVQAQSLRTSGLTRAALRGGRYVPVFTAADTATAVAAAAAGPAPNLVYCYNSELDLIGHTSGCGSEAWALQLTLIDRAVELLAQRLPAGTTLLVTADHGMVDVPEHARIDYDAEPGLSADVDVLAGEARARYVHVSPRRRPAVLARWRDRVGPAMAVLDRDEAIERGWFGPTVTPEAHGRIGDLLAVSTSEAAVVRRTAEPRMAAMIGHHGALTDDELLVPLLTG